MHWFWRVMISTMVGCLGGYGFYSLPWMLLRMTTDQVTWSGEEPIVYAIFLVTFPVTAIMTIVPYALLTHLFPSHSGGRRRR